MQGAVVTRQTLARAAPYLLVCAVAGYLFYLASDITYTARAGTLGPDFWPRLVLGLVIVTALYGALKALFRGRSDDSDAGILQTIVAEPPADAGDAAGPPPHRLWRVAGGIVLTALYVALLQKLGFVVATAPYVAAFLVLGGYRRWGVIGATSIVGTLCMLFLFMKVVYVSLPLGEGVFQQVSLALMQIFGIR
jgi:putative tricarboxylic transport membrane protein